ncbi:hypothetical protein [Thiomonas intermedia]|uniref:hypothetical protein n=1 Tax=Thiomonas intermedia TaxID=926 RepID=UPI0009A4AEF8|nr:hypothetical protein [Thiomonas intermedia]
MSKFNLAKLKLLPALLGWAFLFVVLAFLAAMCIPNAHAADAVSTPNSLTCAAHKKFLGLRDGWDCTSAGSTPLTITAPKDMPFKFWCTGPASSPAECKGVDPQVVQSPAFALVAQPADLDLALKCHITPPSLQAVCQVAVKVKVEK